MPDITEIPFGEYRPDLPARNNPGALLAKNVTPRATSYGPFRALTDYASAANGRVLGGRSTRSSVGQVFTFLGTATKLYKIGSSSPTLEDVSRTSGGDYAADEHWEFVPFGDYVVALNGIDAMQVYQMGVSTDFAALAGSPPLARYGCNAREQIMVGRIAGAPNSVAWCGVDSLTTWGTDPALQSDSQVLAGDSGDVMALVGRLSPHVWCQKSIYTATYDGPPTVWRFDRNEMERGTIFPKSVIGFGRLSFGLGEDNFYMYDGTLAQPISQDKIARTFYEDFDQGYPDRVFAAIDPVAQCLAWAYPGMGHGSGDPNRMLLYHWPSGRWSVVHIALEYLMSGGLSLGFTLEDLDGISGSIDAMTISLDSRVWTSSGAMILAAVSTAHKLGFFTGATLEAQIDTTEVQANPGGKTHIKEAWPRVQGSDATMTVTPIYRNVDHEDVIEATAKAVNALGYAPIRNTAALQRGRLTIAAGGNWTHATGIGVRARPAGRR